MVNKVSFIGETSDAYSQGAALTDAGVFNVVKSAIGTGVADPNGVYFVLTSPDVQETPGFGTQYCGWHTWGTINNTAVKCSFFGNPLLIAPSGCGVRSPAPNGATANVLLGASYYLIQQNWVNATGGYCSVKH